MSNIDPNHEGAAKKTYTRDERMILAAIAFAISFLVGLLLTLWLGHWIWVAFTGLVAGGLCWAYVYQFEQFQAYWTKLGPPAQSTVRKVQSTSSTLSSSAQSVWGFT
ncbi:MAG: hypothetical protein M3Q45_14975 [Chloroflexota bacterium]|nr:hypothetical protein [Chloroflexota bacterium]